VLRRLDVEGVGNIVIGGRFIYSQAWEVRKFQKGDESESDTLWKGRDSS
jgi:hypothetical protein